MNVQAIVDRVLPIFEAHKHEGDIEVEIRLGKHNGSLFDTNVGKDTKEGPRRPKEIRRLGEQEDLHC